MNSFIFVKVVNLIFFVCLLIGEVISDCCRYTEKIKFDPAPGASCHDIPGAYEDGENCVFETCTDLENHSDRWYCGKGECDFFGCNCDGGCSELDQWSKDQVKLLKEDHDTVYLTDIFFIKYKDYVESVNSGVFDKSRVLYRKRQVGIPHRG